MTVARAIMAACAAALGAAPALADVIQIGDDGSVATRAAGGDVRWIGGAAADDAPVVPDAAVTGLVEPDAPAAYRALLARVAAAYGVSADLLAALVRQESGWRTGAVSPKGAVGLAQLMPATSRTLGVDAADPAANLAGGARYLRMLLDRFDGDVERALAAYNAGPARVARAGGVPAIAETRAYVATILGRLAAAAPTAAPAVAITTASLVR